MHPSGLVLVCWAVMSTACLVVEGLVYMPLGFYSYAGGHLNLIGAGTYHQVPLAEVVVFGALFTSMSALRYFRNDRGETLAERGLDELCASKRRAAVLRLLALCGFVQVAMFVSYNLPSMLVGAHSAEWPRDVQTRSYFNNGICGAGTPRPCPGQGVPLLQNTRQHRGARSRRSAAPGGPPARDPTAGPRTSRRRPLIVGDSTPSTRLTTREDRSDGPVWPIPPQRAVQEEHRVSIPANAGA